MTEGFSFRLQIISATALPELTNLFAINLLIITSLKFSFQLHNFDVLWKNQYVCLW